MSSSSFLHEPTYLSSIEVDYECPDHESHDTHGGTVQTMLAHAWAQPIHLKIATQTKEIVITLPLNDYVMHDHTSSHHLHIVLGIHGLAGC
jgi:hypothetical protein